MNTIPILSFKSNDKELLAKEISKLSKQFGFFYIKDHGIDIGLINKVEYLTKNYFVNLPKTMKDQLKVKPNNQFGYFEIGQQKGYSSSRGVDYKEGCYIVYDEQKNRFNDQLMFLTEEEEKQYDLVDFKKTMRLFNKKMYDLCNYIMELIAVSLGLPTNYFSQKYVDPGTYLGLFKYPTFKDNQEAIDGYGMKCHTDFGFITLLFQDNVGGLQVQIGDQFYEVTPVENTLICNFGDMLQSITNDVYKSNPHRVLLNVSNYARYSIGYFYGPPWDTPINNISNDPKSNDDKEKKDLIGVTHLEYFKKQMNDFFRH